MISSTRRDQKTGAPALHDTVRAAHALAHMLVGALHDLPDKRPLIVRKDCIILAGIFARATQACRPSRPVILDEHPDYLDGATSDTGETADMDLALLTGIGAAPLITLAGASPTVPTTDVVLIGHRAT